MTPTQASIDYWRTRALAAEQTIADMERLVVVLPKDYMVLLEYHQNSTKPNDQ